MQHNLKIFWLLSKNSIKTTLQHRAGIISFTLGKIIRFVFYFIFIFFLVSRTKLLIGYTVNQTLLFFLTYNFIDSISQLLFREVYRFRPLIISGEFDSVLLKPHHPFLRILIGGIDILDALLTIPYFCLMLLFILKIPHITFANGILYILFIINSIVISSAFHILVLGVAILTTEIDHMILIFRDITRMVSLPIDIYKEPIYSILMFVIPVGIMITVPVKALLGLLSTQSLMIYCAVSFTFLFITLNIWKKALYKYQSAGN